MKQYKGYYIDHVFFNSEAEIDAHLRNQAVESYVTSVKYFADHPSMEASIYSSDKAETLVNRFGFTWDEVEALEISTLEAIA